MKKFFFTLLMTLMVMFTSCEYTNSNKEVVSTDSIEVVENATPDTILVTMDTIHCVAITKTGEQCKNHRIVGDTLCAVHRKLNK